MNETTLILRAAFFAAVKHKDQRRKDADASPYINHPLGLSRVLAEEGGVTDPATLCAALLHDTIEDTDTTQEELEREFGAEICALVLEVTDDKSLPKAERKQAQVEHAAHISDKAKRVKLADKICNLRDVANSPPATWTLERRQEYFDWSKSVIDNLRGVDAGLEAVFDSAFEARPTQLDMKARAGRKPVRIKRAFEVMRIKNEMTARFRRKVTDVEAIAEWMKRNDLGGDVDSRRSIRNAISEIRRWARLNHTK